MNMKESAILEQATENLKLLTGASLKLSRVEARKSGIDAYIDMEIGGKKSRFLIEVKNEIRHSNLPAFLSRLGTEKEKWLLISQYIPMPVKKELKSQGINYLEAAGNSFIQNKDTFIFINDQKVTHSRLAVEGKVWKTSGLKFVFSVLNHPELLNSTYRQLAYESGIALGNIGPFLNELKKEGFIKEGTRSGKNILFLENKEQLIQRWAGLFATMLRPKLSLGKFRFLELGKPAQWKDINTTGFVWGAENAGALLTNFLQPELYTIYTHQKKTKLMQDLKLVPDQNGRVELPEQFWPDEIQATLKISHVVPPLIAYAELITSLDSRNRETAERIKSGYL